MIAGKRKTDEKRFWFVEINLEFQCGQLRVVVGQEAGFTLRFLRYGCIFYFYLRCYENEVYFFAFVDRFASEIMESIVNSLLFICDFIGIFQNERISCDRRVGIPLVRNIEIAC